MLLTEETWVPIKNILVFLVAFVNMQEARSPGASDTAQTTAATQELWAYHVFPCADTYS